MKLLVLPAKSIVIVVGHCHSLALEDAVDLSPRPRIEAFAGPPDNSNLDRLPHEAGLHHLARRDANHDGSAIGADFDKLGFPKGDQRLADRLAGNAETRRDLLLGQA